MTEADETVDEVEEAIARAHLPRTYRGDVNGNDVRATGTANHDGAMLTVEVVDYEDPDGEPVADEQWSVPYNSAYRVAQRLEELAEEYGLEQDEGGESA